MQQGAKGYFDASQYAEFLGNPLPPLTPDIRPISGPYYWLDPENGRKIAQVLTGRLSETRPNDGPDFEHFFSRSTTDLQKRRKAGTQSCGRIRGAS